MEKNAMTDPDDAPGALMLDDSGPVDPTPEAARQMARTILAANKISDTCWAVYDANHRIVVMVGNVAAGGSRWVGKYDFVVARDDLDGDVAESLAVHQVPKVPKGYGSLIFPQLADTTADTEFLALESAHEAAVDVLGNRYKRQFSGKLTAKI